MRIIIELDKKIDGFKGADRFTREKLVNRAVTKAIEEWLGKAETIDLEIENSECDTLVLSETGSVICRLR
jgi:hypothetical protein